MLSFFKLKEWELTVSLFWGIKKTLEALNPSCTSTDEDYKFVNVGGHVKKKKNIGGPHVHLCHLNTCNILLNLEKKEFQWLKKIG